MRYGVILLLLWGLSSCVSKEKMLYLNDLDTDSARQLVQDYQTKLQPDDLISIFVTTPDNLGVSPFYITPAANNGVRMEPIQYLIRKDGSINFPLLGTLSLAGKTTTEAQEYIKSELSLYLKDPTIIVQWENFKFTVLGEVNRPGSYPVQSERTSILDALGYAGDLTIYGSRQDIRLIRENNGKQEFFNIDLTQADLLASEAFYLKQNDVIIVNPNGSKLQSSNFNSNTSTYLAIASTLISLGILIFR